MERDDTSYLTDRVTHETGRGDPFAAAMRATRTPMVITDPRQADNPIVFANDAFLSFTGYDREDVMGINCRFLQGPDTDRTSIRDIAEAIKLKTDISIDVLNYRKDGSSFWSALYISPVFNKANDLQYFFASQVDITERQDALAAKTVLVHEVDHRVKDNLQMIAAMIVLQANSIADSVARRSLETVLTRIEAVSMVHRRLYQSDDVTRCSVSEFVTDIVTELVAVTGRTDIRVRFELEPVDVSAERAAPLALIVNELVTNVLKHALPADRSGNVAVIVKRNEATFRVTIEDDGVGMSAQPPASTRSFGQNLVRMLTRQLRASVTWSDAEPTGTRVVVDLPLERHAPRSDHGKPAASPLRRG